ncbi:hypothetical protein FPRO06_02049 [Fusarium proliferatum]|nr:hypothetical protein FPRO06_02049 [Fusarium proliferatum]
MEKKARILLPTVVQPIAYETKLHPDFDEEKFQGIVTISCTVIETCSCLELHGKSIQVQEAGIRFKDDSWGVVDTISHDHNKLTIILKHTGKFRRDLTGLYQASYDTDDGVKHRIAATAMESKYVREVSISQPLIRNLWAMTDFSWVNPCFDEPSMRAEFTLSIVVEESFVAVSNMPVGSHPVELFISDTADGKQIYDEISCPNGLCIFRMVLETLSDTKLLGSLKLYLRRHQLQTYGC